MMKKFFILFPLLLFIFVCDANAENAVNDNTAIVICKIVGYIWTIGGPLMTVVIIGSALLAIFGKMPWPALVALGVFCAVFFGASTIVINLLPNTDDSYICGNAQGVMDDKTVVTQRIKNKGKK